MAQQANITVKKFDGVTDVIFAGVLPSSGGNPAIWKAPSLGTAPAHQPELRIKSTSNRAGTVRRVEGVFVYPDIVTASDGTKSIANKAIISFNSSLPQGMALTGLQEAIYQAFNAFATAHVKTQNLEGYAAT